MSVNTFAAAPLVRGVAGLAPQPRPVRAPAALSRARARSSVSVKAAISSPAATELNIGARASAAKLSESGWAV
jgi:hypothetical protein